MGNDELYYLVKFTVDDQTYEEAKRRISELHDLKKGGSGQAETIKEEKEYSEALKETSEEAVSLMDQLIKLRIAQDELRAALKSYKDQQKGGTELDKEQRQAQVETEAQLKNTGKEYRALQSALIANTEAADGTSNSYAQLSAHNAELAIKMRKLPLDDTTGALEEMKKQWEQNNAVLKDFDASMGDHRRNVGNYGETLSVAAGAVASFQGPLGPIAGRMNAVNTTLQRAIPLLKGKATGWKLVGRAMMMTGIGAIIVALGALIGMLSKLQPVMDAVAMVGRVLSASFGNMTDALGAFLGMNERSNLSVGESIRLARELHRAQIDLEEQQIRNIVANAELEASIARLRMEAEDEVNSHRDRISAMEEAIGLTEKNMAIKEDEAAQALWIAEQRARIAVNDREANEELAKAEAALINVRQQQFTQMRQLVRRRQSIINQLRVEEERRRRNIQAIIDERDAAIDSARKRADAALLTAQREAEERGIQARIDVLRESGREQQAIALETQREITRIEREFHQERMNIQKEFNQAYLADARLLRMQNLTEEQAGQEASVRANEQYNNRIIALQELRDQMTSRLTEKIAKKEASARRVEAFLGEEAAQYIKDEAERLRQDLESITRQKNDEIKALEAEKNEFIRKETKRLFSQNLSDQQIHEQARASLAERFKNIRLRLLEAEWQEYVLIQEQQANQANALTLDRLQEESNALAEHFKSISMMEMQEAQRRLAIQQTGTDELVRLEQERGQRMNDLRLQYIEQGIDEVEAAEMASYRARLEFAEQFADAELAIERYKLDEKLAMREGYADLTMASLNALFQDNKAAQAASALVDAWAGINVQLASAPASSAWLRAAAVGAQGLANVRRILSTEIGSTPSGGAGFTAGASATRGFEVIERETIMSEGAVARQVAQSASSATSDTTPTFEFHGDLNKEVMAIKVRQGNRLIDTKTLTTKSRN